MFTNKTFFSLILIFSLALAVVACGGTNSNSPADENPKEVKNTDNESQNSNEVDQVNTESQSATTQEKVESVTGADGMRTFKIVPEESNVSYIANEEFFEDALAKYGINAGLNEVIGSTQAVEGQLQINPENMGGLLGENSFKVDMRTLKTDQQRRDNYILDNGPAFNQFPEALFTATEISGLPENYADGEEIQFELSGDLTVHNVVVPVTFVVTATLVGDTLSGVAETSQLMSNFGIDPPDFARTLTVADDFGIRVEFTAREG